VHPAITAPRLIRLDGLTGRFDEALAQADVLWDGWLYATTAGVESELSSLRGDWPSSAAAIVALVHGLDEIQVHLVPDLLGGGVRLFDLLGADPVELVRDRVVESGSGVTHLRYRVKR
jgi:hypothetical protein